MPLSKEADRERKRKQAAAKKEQADVVQAQEDLAASMGDRPTVEDAEAAYGDGVKEAAIKQKLIRYYGKSRTWACIMYQDSAPPDWEDKLRMIGVAFAVSPLHDQDLTKDGKPKKPHWHVILDWPHGSTTYGTAAGISQGILKGTIPIPLASPRGYYRYLCHLDNPNKAQYNQDDIVRGNGFDIGDFLELTAQEKADIRRKLLELVLQLDIIEYWDLLMYTLYNCDAATHNYVCDNTMFWTKALASRRGILEREAAGGRRVKGERSERENLCPPQTNFPGP